MEVLAWHGLQHRVVMKGGLVFFVLELALKKFGELPVSNLWGKEDIMSFGDVCLAFHTMFRFQIKIRTSWGSSFCRRATLRKSPPFGLAL